MNIIYIILSTFIFLVTFKMFFVFLMGIIKAYKAKNWPFVEGIITQNNYDAPPSEGYDVEMEFQYEVNKKIYRAITPYFGPTNKVGASQRKLILNSLKQDTTTKVYYNPKCTNEAILITGFNRFQQVSTGFNRFQQASIRSHWFAYINRSN